MTGSSLLRILAGVFCAVSGLAQPPISTPAIKTTAPPRVFIHTRSESMDRPFLDTWKLGDTTYLIDAKEGKSFRLSYESLKETGYRPPALKEGWVGQLKFRHEAWWFLQIERGVRPQDKVSTLFRFDTTSKSWSQRHEFEIRANNFEVMDEDRILLFGVFSPNKKSHFVAATVSGSSSTVSLLDEAPIKQHFPDLFWKTSVTSIDDQMAYVYFPYSGRIYGYDLISHSLREFRVPWHLLSDQSMAKEIEAAKTAGKTDCFISAVGHPGASNCYFLPMPGGQMAFIYKVLDEEEEKRLAFSDGKRPLIERVGCLMLVPDDPHMMIELTTPSQKTLERLCWSSSAGRLVRWENLVVPKKESAAKSTAKAL